MQGAGVFYGAAASDATAPAGSSAFVVGAGNSAGQAAVHLARSAASVVLVARDERGYVLTGRDVTGPWPLERPPLLLETSLPGVFAAGDVRHGSVKRVASAVGAGGIAVQLVHVRLAELDGAPPFIADRRGIPEPDAPPPSEMPSADHGATSTTDSTALVCTFRSPPVHEAVGLVSYDTTPFVFGVGYSDPTTEPPGRVRPALAEPVEALARLVGLSPDDAAALRHWCGVILARVRAAMCARVRAGA